jgi:hypothetical protein
VVVPVTRWLHERFGFVAFVALVLGAAAVDAVAFNLEFSGLRWANYGFVWLSMHQLGYLWRAERIRGTAAAISLAGTALACLLVLLALGPYPLSMISVPGDAISNSAQPTLALLALGVMQGGIVLVLEPGMRRWLSRPRPWALTVLINGSIMTLFLWHTTVMVLMVGASVLLEGFGLGFVPDTPAWWATRPLWILALGGVLLLFVGVFGRFERGSRLVSPEPLSAWRAVLGSSCICGGLAMFALNGIAAEGVLGVDAWTVLLTCLGAALVLAPSFANPRNTPA